MFQCMCVHVCVLPIYINSVHPYYGVKSLINCTQDNNLLFDVILTYRYAVCSPSMYLILLYITSKRLNLSRILCIRHQTRHYVFGLYVLRVRSFVCPSVHSSTQILLPWYLMNGLSYVGDSVAPNDDRFRFWRSKVKGQGHSWPSSWQRHPRWRCGVEVHLLLRNRFKTFYTLKYCEIIAK